MTKEMAEMKREVEELKEDNAALREQVDDMAENMRVGFLRVIEILEKLEKKKKKKKVVEDKEEDRSEGGSKDGEGREE